MSRTPRNEMQAHWEQFAQDDPMWYIATWNADWTVDDFLQSGQKIVENTLDWIGRDLQRGRMLEIGCGLGRTSFHFAKFFQEVDAIDISANMIVAAKKLNPPSNLHFAASSGKDLEGFPDSTFDLVFCYIVLQHIPDEAVITTYLHEIARVLKPGALAALQFDTRSEGLLVRLYKSLPDPLLMRNHRRYIRRYRRKHARLLELFAGAGLTVQDEQGTNTEENFFLVRR